MIRRMTYNCDPDSLGDVSQEAFVDAFENVVHADPRFRECDVTVTFTQAMTSNLVSMAIDDESPESDPVRDYGQTVRDMADDAFSCCLAP